MTRPRALHVAAGNLYGGVERILVEIAKAPAAWRHEFAICFDGRLSHELDGQGAERHLLGEARFSRPWTIWQARRRLRALCSAVAYEAVVCHSPWPYALAAPVLDRPPVLWAHDALRGDHWTERRVARRRPRVIVCNSRYTESAIRGWLEGAPCALVYAPVSEPVPSVSRRDVRLAFGVRDDVVVIAMASRFERWKGHADLLRAAAHLDGDCEVWIAGIAQRSHEREYERELQELARQLGISPRVRFLQDRVNVPDLFAAADIHCQPNTAPEPFGIAFVEALYARLPVVTSDAGGAREIVTRDCGVLVPMGDAETLTAALRVLVGDPQTRFRLGAAGPARARELCDPVRRISDLESALGEASGAVA
jgi:glycosyltransferase involved in cell wall biosynthesis